VIVRILYVYRNVENTNIISYLNIKKKERKKSAMTD